MRLQKQLSKKIRGKVYPKWVLIIPPKIVKAMGWKVGEELEALPFTVFFQDEKRMFNPVYEMGHLRIVRKQKHENG